jgi:16S rRNA (cytosine967-C5)-methyltransferase
MERWLAGSAKAETLTEAALFDSETERRRCQYLFYGAIRWQQTIRADLSTLVKRVPGRRLEALLHLAAFELIAASQAAEDEKREGDSRSQAPKVINQAVTQARALLSQRESGFVNAVLRRLLQRLEDRRRHLAQTSVPIAADLALAYSHPRAMVERWQASFGTEATVALLELNQTPPPVYLRLRASWKSDEAQARLLEAGLAEPSTWRGFWRILPGADWRAIGKLLEAGDVYIQDPSTRLAPELLAPQAGECVLDLCGAPGGKTLMLADLMFGSGNPAALRTRPGQLVSIDQPAEDARREQWRRNLLHLPPEKLKRLEADVTALSPRILETHGVSGRHHAVLIDVPCSNSGVLRRRPEAKLRLSPASIAGLGELQQKMLAASSGLVQPGGRLVYSTCSIEPEENTAVVERFLASDAGQSFSLVRSTVSLPWETGHDGAGAFLLARDSKE